MKREHLGCRGQEDVKLTDCSTDRTHRPASQAADRQGKVSLVITYFLRSWDIRGCHVQSSTC